jgi:hypothetical protein
MMKRSSILIIFFIILVLLTLPIFFIRYKIPQASTNMSNEFYKKHILGGFSIDTPERAMNKSTDGIQVVFKYGDPPSDNSALGKTLRSLHMKVEDGYISGELYYYECHRTKTVKPPPSGHKPWCTVDYHPELNSERVLLTKISYHLQQVKNNSLIIGYWVLDDWAPWDSGSAKQLLIDIHRLIQHSTPDRPAICGFGGSIHVGTTTYGWRDQTADNFSPFGCDMVGLYIYTPSTPNPTSRLSPDVYDWSMSAVLPAMFASLQKRGWSISREPLIGIGQAIGGPLSPNDYWVTPTAKDIETQSRSFCEHGAAGLTFYAWDNSGIGPMTQTPMNNSQIAMGIQNGIAACKQYWSDHS